MSEPQSDVCVFGEALVDFLPSQTGALRHVETFTKVVGGAPANLATTLARLGSKPRLLTRVGADEFGSYLLEALTKDGVDVDGVIRTRDAKTGITFVSVAENGERSFLFFREPSADLTVAASDFCETAIDASILHLGSNLMTYPGGREASFEIASRARAEKVLVSMDANIRLHLWEDRSEAVPTLFQMLGNVDILKISEEELVLLEPSGDMVGLHERVQALGVSWLVVTLGEAGSLIFTKSEMVRAEGVVVDVVDTTGAGDAFLAGFLHTLIGHDRIQGLAPKDWLSAAWTSDELRELLHVGNQYGALACTALGATTAISPQLDHE